MDIKEKLKYLNANSFYGLYPKRRSRMTDHTECKECSLHSKGECNENCLQFKRLKRAECVEKHPNINRKDLLNYLRGLARFNENDFDLGFNYAINSIINKVESPEEALNEQDVAEDKEEQIMATKCSKIRCPMQHNNNDDCNIEDCPYRTEAIDPQEVINSLCDYIASLVAQKLTAEKEGK